MARPEPGTIFRIALGEGSSGYARVLVPPVVAFHHLFDEGSATGEEVVAAPVAFRVYVMDRALRSRAWERIGTLPLSERESGHAEIFFKQDPKGTLTTYSEDPVTKEPREEPSDPEACASLEAAAVWSANHIEDRLRDLRDGQRNKWADSLRPRG